MRAMVQDRYGPADVLELRTVDRPHIGDDQVPVEVHAAGADRGTEDLMKGLPTWSAPQASSSPAPRTGYRASTWPALSSRSGTRSTDSLWGTRSSVLRRGRSPSTRPPRRTNWPPSRPTSPLRRQLRTRAAMSDLASRTDRFLGGRPPYGYCLVDAGPHPNPGRAAAGQRAHRLVPDEVTAPVVGEIFQRFVSGAGVRAIAQHLTDAGIPSPSAHDPARNSHRDPRGWAFSAVRAILANEVYTGRRVWAKQRKVEELLDPDDVAAGNRTRLRWRPEDEWIRPELKTHDALIDGDLFAAATGRLASPKPRTRRPRSSTHPYPLRGILFCSICGRRMEGTWRKMKAGETGRVLYRCAVRQNRALPEDFPDHPSTLYLREDAILGPLDEWIASITTAVALAEHQLPPTRTQPSDLLKTRLAEVDRKIASLIAAVEAGADLPQLTDQLKRRASERSGLEAQLRAIPREHHMSSDELRDAIADLGGMPKILASANPAAREKVYQSLGIRLEYDHEARRVTANAAEACVFNRVRRGT